MPSDHADSNINALKNVEVSDSSKTKVTYKMPKERLKDANVLRAIHIHLVDADEASERNRAKVQDLKDHKPPLRADLLRARGQSGRFNINFGETAAMIDEAKSGYVDAFVSPQHLVPVRLKINQFEPTQQAMFERILSDEYTRMVRGWTDGLFSYMTLVDQFVTHGVGVGYFQDRNDWQWSAAGLREFKFPRRTKASNGAVEMATCEIQSSPAELSEKIENEDHATSMGWNVQEVKKVMGTTSDQLYDLESPEDWKEQEKANDFRDEINPFSVVNLVYSWVREMDGTVSFYITTKGGNSPYKNTTPNEEYLFRKINAYENMGEALHIFSFHTGNKGNIYTIRGLGYMAYSQAMASNLMQCALLDSAKDSMSVKFVSPSEKGITSIPIINAGPYSLIPPSLQLLPDQKAPDLQKSAIPALDLLRSQMDRKSSASTLSNVFNNAPDRRSSAEALAAVEHFSSLNSAAMLLWSRPWRDLIVESLKRAFSDGQNDQIPSGKMASDMQQACIDRGVPREAFAVIDLHLTKTAIPVGPGSKAARQAQFQQGAALYTSMDVTGRAAFDRDRAIDIFGPEKASEYINFGDAPRETHDHAIARLENNDLIEGQEIVPSPSENFLVHLDIHINKLIEFIQLVEQGQVELTEATRDMITLFEHATNTFEMAVVPEVAVPELNKHKQTLQQVGEYVSNGIRAIQKEEREGNAPQEDGEGQDGEQQAALQKHQQQMQIDAEKALAKLNQDQESFEQSQVQARAKALQDIEITDAKAAREIKR